jgi:hypothetical protein
VHILVRKLKLSSISTTVVAPLCSSAARMLRARRGRWHRTG